MCCTATVAWGFSHQDYVRIQATALDSNLASMRVLDKCGFRLEGKLRNFRLVRAQPRDFWLYARIPDDAALLPHGAQREIIPPAE